MRKTNTSESLKPDAVNSAETTKLSEQKLMKPIGSSMIADQSNKNSLISEKAMSETQLRSTD